MRERNENHFHFLREIRIIVPDNIGSFSGTIVKDPLNGLIPQASMDRNTAGKA